MNAMDDVTITPTGITIRHPGRSILTVIDRTGETWSKVEFGTKLYCFRDIVDAVHFLDARAAGDVAPSRFDSFSHVEINPEALAAPDLLADLAAREHGAPERDN